MATGTLIYNGRFDSVTHYDHAGGNAVYRGMGVPVYASAATESLEASIAARMAGWSSRSIGPVSVMWKRKSSPT